MIKFLTAFLVIFTYTTEAQTFNTDIYGTLTNDNIIIQGEHKSNWKLGENNADFLFRSAYGSEINRIYTTLDYDACGIFSNSLEGRTNWNGEDPVARIGAGIFYEKYAKFTGRVAIDMYPIPGYSVGGLEFGYVFSHKINDLRVESNSKVFINIDNETSYISKNTVSFDVHSIFSVAVITVYDNKWEYHIGIGASL